MDYYESCNHRYEVRFTHGYSISHLIHITKIHAKFHNIKVLQLIFGKLTVEHGHSIKVFDMI